MHHVREPSQWEPLWWIHMINFKKTVPQYTIPPFLCSQIPLNNRTSNVLIMRHEKTITTLLSTCSLIFICVSQTLLTLNSLELSLYHASACSSCVKFLYNSLYLTGMCTWHPLPIQPMSQKLLVSILITGFLVQVPLAAQVILLF